MEFECNNCKAKLSVATNTYTKHNKDNLGLVCPLCTYGSSYGEFIPQPHNKVNSKNIIVKKHTHGHSKKVIDVNDGDYKSLLL